MGSSTFHSRFSRESTSSSLDPQQPPHRRMLSRSSPSPSPSPNRNSLSSLHNIFHPRSASPALPKLKFEGAETKKETDAQCWERMLAMQMEYHCYNSARLEAAVEALEMGWGIESLPIPSRLCLDLLNEELRAQIESEREGYSQ